MSALTKSALQQAFEKERDLPFRIPLSAGETDACCLGKHLRLRAALEALGFPVRWRICWFRWSDLKLPQPLLEIPHEDESSYLYIEANIGGNWLALDASWDPGLASILPVNAWTEPFSGMPVGVPAHKILSPEESATFMDALTPEAAEDDLHKNGDFVKELNEYLHQIRASKQNPTVPLAPIPSDPIETNRQTWNTVCDLFAEASALPFWAPFGVGDDLGLLPDLAGKTILEIACGSGRSLKYLTDHGARKAYGLDLSDEQIKEAARYNAQAIADGKIQLFRGRMEDRVEIEPVDHVFSVYGFGWTPDPKTSLANVYAYLKPGGTFTWSWDHTFFSDIAYEDGRYVVHHAYHEELPVEIVDWKRKGCVARLTYRKTDTWFRLLLEAGFEIIGYHEPKPKSLRHAHAELERYYSLQKAELVPASFIFVCRKKGE